ncbi:MAG TPA: hypothetical protein VFE32_20360 [Puia sp.]|jgi:hypothetical protein|nr:hypothetical protein [Puia sp.]
MSLPRLFALSSFFLCLASCRSDPSNSHLKEIDNGLRLSIHFIAGQNEEVYASIQQKMTDATTRDLSNLWSSPAFKVRLLSARIISFIDSLHTKMTTLGSISKEDEKSLFDALVNCKHDLLDVFPDSLDPYKQFLANDREGLKRHIPLLFDSSAHGQPGLTFTEWSDLLFQRDTTLIALSLDKLKIDILLSEQEIVKYCDIHVKSTIDRFDIFAALITLNSNVVAPGDTIKLSAGIGAYYSSARPNITIAGVSVPTISGGLAFYTLRASKRPGQYSIPVRIEFTTPYGHRSTLEQYVRYQVSNLRIQ